MEIKSKLITGGGSDGQIHVIASDDTSIIDGYGDVDNKERD